MGVTLERYRYRGNRIATPWAATTTAATATGRLPGKTRGEPVAARVSRRVRGRPVARARGHSGTHNPGIPAGAGGGEGTYACWSGPAIGHEGQPLAVLLLHAPQPRTGCDERDRGAHVGGVSREVASTTVRRAIRNVHPRTLSALSPSRATRVGMMPSLPPASIHPDTSAAAVETVTGRGSGCAQAPSRRGPLVRRSRDSRPRGTGHEHPRAG
jgi:hypothetical protein